MTRVETTRTPFPQDSLASSQSGIEGVQGKLFLLSRNNRPMGSCFLKASLHSLASIFILQDHLGQYKQQHSWRGVKMQLLLPCMASVVSRTGQAIKTIAGLLCSYAPEYKPKDKERTVTPSWILCVVETRFSALLICVAIFDRITQAGSLLVTWRHF